MKRSNIRILTENVNPHGGINFIIDAMRKIGMPDLIDSELGLRPKQAKYAYSDVLLSWIYSTLCGGQRLEDSEKIGSHLKGTPNVKIPSSDSLGLILKTFTEQSIVFKAKSGVTHNFNINYKLHRLLLSCCKKMRLLNGNEHTLDYDHVVIPCEKHDSTFCYKHVRAYQPGVGIISRIPVYFENRSGHSPAAYKMTDSLRRCFSLLTEKQIRVKRFRSDAAAYQKAVISYLSRKKMEFFIRAELRDEIMGDQQFFDWKEIFINKQRLLATSVEFEPFGDGKKYRYVITKYVDFKTDTPNKTTGEYYLTRAIVTSNRTWSDKQVVEFYNRRGDDCERSFDQMLNDFNLSRCPFSFMEQNSVFMVLTAIVCAIYRYVLKKFSKKIPSLNVTFRLKRFIFLFISVAAFWKEGILTLYDPDGRFKPLLAG